MSRRKAGDAGKPRKLPKGPVGQAIVEAILGATRRILSRDGYEALTSNAIAQEAGVSIGSFYQYFPNHDAVLAELAREIEFQSYELARARVEEGENDVLSVIDNLIEILASEMLGEVSTRATLLHRIPRGWIKEASSEVDRRVMELVERGLVAHRDSLPHVRDPKISAFVLVTAVEAVVEASVQQQPDWLTTGKLHAELRSLVMRYLGVPESTKPAADAASPS